MISTLRFFNKLFFTLNHADSYDDVKVITVYLLFNVVFVWVIVIQVSYPLARVTYDK